MDQPRTVEEYTKEIYQLEQDHGRRVQTAELAEAVDRSQASVTHMLQQLDEAGLVDYQEYHGATVTDDGTDLALSLMRKHRLLETFLTEQLELPWPEVHEEADRLEHYISDIFTDRLAARLGNPDKDPHGDPIPDEELTLAAEASGTDLVDCAVGEVCVIDQVPHHHTDIREYLFANNIDPGTTIEVTAVADVGLVTVTNRDTDEQVSVPDRVARQITVRPSPQIGPA